MAAIGFNSRRASKERRGSLEMDGFHPRPGDPAPILSRYSTVGGIRYTRISYIYIYVYNAIGPPRGLLQP